MKIAVVAITRNGAELALRIGYDLKADIYIKSEFIERYIITGEMFFIHPVTADFSAFVGKIFKSYDGIVFVMACGIVVRTIAPFIKDKVNDPAVVVVDEKGNHAISLISGHIGGANKLAREVAAITRGVPVITTATDISGVMAFDVLAAENNSWIENIQDLKLISSELVNGGKVHFFTDNMLSGEFPQNIIYEGSQGAPGKVYHKAVVLTNNIKFPVKAETVLIIRPRNLILGIGCKKGTRKSSIEKAVIDFLQKNNKSIFSLKEVISIDLKKEEKGIVEFCMDKNLNFRTISAEVIKTIENRFAGSEFVKKTTGVGSVAEACAVLGGENTKLICRKTVYKGITLALAEEERVFYI
ncbi:MAG: cobalt-precorrin 5A hydrolase [Acetivibrionales bacterium]|jgi:cobalt-precorrin 5A hydrolase